MNQDNNTSVKGGILVLREIKPHSIFFLEVLRKTAFNVI